MTDIEMIQLQTSMTIVTALMAMVPKILHPNEAEPLVKAMRESSASVASILAFDQAVRACPVQKKLQRCGPADLEMLDGYWMGVRSRLMQTIMTSSPPVIQGLDQLIAAIRVRKPR
jgi:hypothetical protein